MEVLYSFADRENQVLDATIDGNFVELDLQVDDIMGLLSLFTITACRIFALEYYYIERGYTYFILSTRESIFNNYDDDKLAELDVEMCN